MKTGQPAARTVFLLIPLFLTIATACSTNSSVKKPEKNKIWKRWNIPLYDAPLPEIAALLDRDASKPSIRFGDDNMGYFYDGRNITFYYRKKKGIRKVFLAGNFNEWKPDHPKWRMKPGDKFFLYKIPLMPTGQQRILFKFVADGSWQIYSHSTGPGQWD